MNDNNSVSRMTRGEKIAREKVISENADGSFCVPSQTVEEIVYLVRFLDGKFICNCMDFKERHEQIGLCKHIHAVKFWVASQTFLQEKPKPKIFSPDSIQCQKCGSIRVVKYGFDAEKQIYKCKDCKTKFRYSLLKKAKYSPETVSLTLDLYFSGMSLAKIANTLNRNYDMTMNKITVYRWIQKFIPKISDYVNSLAPQLSDTWHADELFVKMKNGVEYKADTREWHRIAFLWNVMDRKTRFLLSSKLSAYRDKDGAFQAFKEARNNSHGRFPEKIFVDGARAYNNIAHAQVKHWNPQVIARSGINKPHANNNRIERLNGTLRERVKVQRGWKSMESQIAEGQRIHYNFVKPHQSLAGMTPAQRAGILEGRNWLELLSDALKESK
jgi:transposase-like protein